MRPEDNPQDWHQQKTYESMITYGVNAVKFVLIANGGAILSILTFLGNHPDRIGCIKPALILFMIGVVCGGAVNITAYMTQLSLFNQRSHTVRKLHDHRTWLYISMALSVGGLIGGIANPCSCRRYASQYATTTILLIKVKIV